MHGVWPYWRQVKGDGVAKAMPGIRADAVRNRAHLLAIADEVFAAEGSAVSVNEIIRRAGVGSGTFYRHFATKEALFEEVIEDRVRAVVVRGRELLASDPDQALFVLLAELIGGVTADRGLADVLRSYGINARAVEPGGLQEAFLRMVTDVLRAAQRAGTARTDVGVVELMALLTVYKVPDEQPSDVRRRVLEVILDGLRTQNRPTAVHRQQATGSTG